MKTSDVDTPLYILYIKLFKYIFDIECEKESVTLASFILFLSLDLLDRATLTFEILISTCVETQWILVLLLVLFYLDESSKS